MYNLIHSNCKALMCHQLYWFCEISTQGHHALFVIVAVCRWLDWILNLTTFSNMLLMIDLLLGVPYLWHHSMGILGLASPLSCMHCCRRDAGQGSLSGRGMYCGSQDWGMGWAWHVWWDNANQCHWAMGKCADTLYRWGPWQNGACHQQLFGEKSPEGDTMMTIQLAPVPINMPQAQMWLEPMSPGMLKGHQSRQISMGEKGDNRGGQWNVLNVFHMASSWISIACKGIEGMVASELDMSSADCI